MLAAILSSHSRNEQIWTIVNICLVSTNFWNYIDGLGILKRKTNDLEVRVLVRLRPENRRNRNVLKWMEKFPLAQFLPLFFPSYHY